MDLADTLFKPVSNSVLDSVLCRGKKLQSPYGLMISGNLPVSACGWTAVFPVVHQDFFFSETKGYVDDERDFAKM